MTPSTLRTSQPRFYLSRSPVNSDLPFLSWRRRFPRLSPTRSPPPEPPAPEPTPTFPPSAAASSVDLQTRASFVKDTRKTTRLGGKGEKGGDADEARFRSPVPDLRGRIKQQWDHLRTHG